MYSARDSMSDSDAPQLLQDGNSIHWGETLDNRTPSNRTMAIMVLAKPEQTSLCKKLFMAQDE